MQIDMVLIGSRGDYTLQTNNIIGQGVNFGFLPRHDAAPSEWLLHHARWTLVAAATGDGRAATLRRNITVKNNPQKGNAFASSVFGIGESRVLNKRDRGPINFVALCPAPQHQTR